MTSWRTKSARDAYQFLAANEGKLVTYEQISAATGGVWSVGTVSNYRSKKWKKLLVREGAKYRVTGISTMKENEFVALQSQVTEAILDPRIKLIDDSIAIGEGQNVEFKSQVPKNAGDLSTEIAALASSGGGTILMGITDSGAVVGYDDGRERLEGLIKNVAPVPTATVDLVPYRDKNVGLIRVLAGPEPVYYANDRPYIRQGSLTRPATPDEVKAIFQKHFDRG